MLSAPVLGSRETGVSEHFCCHGIGNNRRAIPRANSTATGTAIMITPFTPILDAASINSRLCVSPSNRLKWRKKCKKAARFHNPSTPDTIRVYANHSLGCPPTAALSANETAAAVVAPQRPIATIATVLWSAAQQLDRPLPVLCRLPCLRACLLPFRLLCSPNS